MKIRSYQLVLLHRRHHADWYGEQDGDALADDPQFEADRHPALQLVDDRVGHARHGRDDERRGEFDREHQRARSTLEPQRETFGPPGGGAEMV